MSAFVADTQAILWLITQPEKLGRAARRAFAAAEAGKGPCHVPAVVLVEFALLHEKGRFRIGARQLAETLGARSGFAVLAVDVEQCLEFAGLVGIRDPMDRLIAAAARSLNAPLISSDSVFDDYLPRIWD